MTKSQQTKKTFQRQLNKKGIALSTGVEIYEPTDVGVRVAKLEPVEVTAPGVVGRMADEIKDPRQLALPEGSYVKGSYVYTPVWLGKTRWFDTKLVAVQFDEGKPVTVLAPKAMLKARGMLELSTELQVA